MQERALQWEQCSLIDREPGRAGSRSADVEVGYMNIVPQCDIFKNIMVPRRYRVVEIILG